MALEIQVYASIIKDLLYSLALLGLFWILHFPTYWLWFLHAATWVAALCYYISNDRDFWFSTAAVCLTVSVAAVDFFILINTVCYLNGVQCCLNGQKVSPFTISFQVCGANNRYDNAVLLWIAIATIALGILTSIARAMNMYNSRKASSIETMLFGLYCGAKIYMLRWYGISYTTFFWFQSILTMAANLVALLISFKFRLVSTLIFAAIILVDMLVVLGATHSINFFQEAANTATHTTIRRHLLETVNDAVAVVTLPDIPVRAALSNAAGILAALAPLATPNEAQAALATSAGMMESFVTSIRQTCETAKQQTDGAFVCDDSVAQANAAYQLVQMNANSCCDVNTNYIQTVSTVQNQLQTLDASFDNTWALEHSRLDQAVASKSVVNAAGTAVEQSSGSTYTPGSIPSSTNDWKAFGQFLQKNIGNFFKNLFKGIWNKLFGKNVKQIQTPWITKTGKKVPLSIYWVWISTHIATVGLTVFELFGTLTRSHKVPGPFGAGKTMKGDEDGAGEGLFKNIQFASGQARRRKNTGAHESIDI